MYLQITVYYNRMHSVITHYTDSQTLWRGLLLWCVIWNSITLYFNVHVASCSGWTVDIVWALQRDYYQNIPFFSFTLYLVYSWVCSGSLVLRHSDSHLASNSRGVLYWVAKLNAEPSVKTLLRFSLLWILESLWDTRAKNRKY